MQAGQCGSQMGTKSWEGVCDEHGIGGDGGDCGGNDAQLDRTNVLYREASGGKYMPRAVLFDLGPGVIDALRASPLGELFRPGNFVNRGKQQGEGPLHKGLERIMLNSPVV